MIVVMDTMQTNSLIQRKVQPFKLLIVRSVKRNDQNVSMIYTQHHHHRRVNFFKVMQKDHHGLLMKLLMFSFLVLIIHPSILLLLLLLSTSTMTTTTTTIKMKRNIIKLNQLIQLLHSPLHSDVKIQSVDYSKHN